MNQLDPLALDTLTKVRRETIIDTLELLAYLRAESSNCHYQHIDEMINRLYNMLLTLVPGC
jgi:hypothetical protein